MLTFCPLYVRTRGKATRLPPVRSLTNHACPVPRQVWAILGFNWRCATGKRKICVTRPKIPNRCFIRSKMRYVLDDCTLFTYKWHPKRNWPLYLNGWLRCDFPTRKSFTNSYFNLTQKLFGVLSVTHAIYDETFHILCWNAAKYFGTHESHNHGLLIDYEDQRERV